MNKNNILIPKPKSRYLSVQCNHCNEKTVVYSHTTANITCKSCNEIIAKSSGGMAKIFGNIISTLD